MRASTLSRIENYPGFLGTFDHVSWWKSETITGLQTIISVAWIYGEYHVCAAKMDDGTYSIWQSYNHGYSWREQLNTAERIYCVIQPDYGIALASTSGGWWRSTNSGTDWTKISTQAPGCHTVVELTKDRLVALDGTYVWYSDDGGATWSKSVKSGTATPVTAVTLYPSVAGTFNDVFIGCTSTNAGGSGTDRLIYSDNGAASFVEWHSYYGGANGWDNRESYRDTNHDVITDIEIVKTVNMIPTFLIQVLMPTGYLRHYTAYREYWVGDNELATTAIFDGYATPGKSLAVSESVTPGTADISRMAIYSGSSNGVPVIKVSADGGVTWTDVDPSAATVYLVPDGSDTTSNPFVEDSYITYSWVHGICHNMWRIIDDHYEMRQSYDADVTWLPFEYHDAEYEASAYVEGTDSVSYLAAPHRIEAVGSETYDADALLSTIHDETYDAGAGLEAICSMTYRGHRYLEGYTTSAYQAGALVLSTTFPTVILPQSLNVRFPWVSESGYPYDSREET